ncbi:hypothetical protein Tco_1359876 [Tanacetum coccineum]
MALARNHLYKIEQVVQLGMVKKIRTLFLNCAGLLLLYGGLLTPYVPEDEFIPDKYFCDYLRWSVDEPDCIEEEAEALRLFKWTYESRWMKYNTDVLHSDRIPRETNMYYICQYLHQKIWAKIVLKPEPQEGGSAESVSKETMNEPENKKKKMRKA